MAHMSSNIESGRGVERPEATSIEQAKQEHIGGAELDSIGFQAIADCVHLQNAQASFLKDPETRFNLLRYHSIHKRIELRKDGIKGYKEEYERAEEALVFT
jgi:hypothetical protein